MQTASNIRPEFPQAIDSTIRAAWRACPQKFKNEYLHHWSPVASSVHLIAGGAFARGLEVARKAHWDDGLSPEESLNLGIRELLREYGDFECPPDSAKSPDRMVEALDHCFKHYGWDTDYIQPYKATDRHVIEYRFGLPIDVTHPVTGNPMIYCGRFDMVGVFQDQLWVVDDKTTTRLGDSWVNQWALRGQITGYCWAAQQYGLPVAGAILRGTAILKTKITHAESIQYRPPGHIARWYEQLCRDVEAMIQAWESGVYDYDFADSCSAYGGCQFAPVCISDQPEKVLENHFVKRIWDPMEIAKVKVKEVA